MFRRLILLFAVTVLVATPKPCRAQQGARADFSGRWIMDSTRSSRDGILSSLTLTVRRAGDTLFVRSDGANAGGTFSANSIFDVTGRATENNNGGVLTSTAASTAFLTTIAKDTFGLEQYNRVGNVISGTWVVLHPPGVYVHDFRITVGDDGLPARYTMRYRTPGAMTRPDLDSVTVVYGRDSATLEFHLRDSSLTRRIALREGFPLLGQAFVGVELALMRLRSLHVDSSAIALHPPSDPAGQMTRASVRFFAGDSALVAGTMRIHVDSDGRILGLRSGPLELKRVEAFDITGITDGFVKAFAPRVAAQAAAAASRVEIALPPAQLDRFVGDYSSGPATISIAHEGEHLVLHVPQQQGIQLLAMSATDFFVRKPDLVVAFDTDPTGRVAALTVGQGDTKQRFIRKN